LAKIGWINEGYVQNRGPGGGGPCTDVTGNGAGGGGISLFAAGGPTIRGNVISGNSVDTSGGGIGMVNASDPFIIDNVISGNTAAQDGGIITLVPSGATGPVVVNNTFASNSTPHHRCRW